MFVGVSRPLAGPALPVDAVLPALRSALAGGTSAVLVAPPGAGKTTRVPLALLDEAWMAGRRLVMLEPRRLAARAAAAHMTRLLGEAEVGGTVGYRVRLDTRVGPGTRVEVVTEGVLTRMLQTDPSLEGVGAVLLDEFHERSLPADLGLALTLHARSLLRPDLRVVVMSATLDAGPVAALLGDAPVVASEGRAFDVETRYVPPPDREATPWAVARAVAGGVLGALAREDGDVLAFLPGAAEIRRVAEALEEADPGPRVDVVPLHGRLDRGAQDRAVAPSRPGRRKVVLATSIAETSLTIDGVRVVVDSGWMRVPRFDPGSGMTRLETVRVTRDAADQRRGRAGRTGPGVCLRLWSEDEDRGLIPARVPELREADLAPLLLDLAAFGAAPDDLAWLDPPAPAGLAQARELLSALDLVDSAGRITADGEAVVGLGVHPRMGHMLVRGRAEGRGGLACVLAAVLGERDVLRGEGRAPAADLRLRVEAVARRGEVGLGGHRVDRGGLARIEREAAHLGRRLGVDPSGVGADAGTLAAVGPLVAWAYPDRVALCREGGRTRYLLRNGRGARLFDDDPLAGSEALVAAHLDGVGREARVFLAAPLSLDDLVHRFGDQVVDEEEVAFHSPSGRVRARRVRRLGALELAEAPLRGPDPGAVAAALCEGLRGVGLQALPWSRETHQLKDRLRFLHRVEPEAWPDGSDEALVDDLERWLAPFLTGMKSLDDLRKVDLEAALSARVGWKARRRLDDLAPSHIEVPSGSRIAVDYSDPGAPVLAVRLQEVFGWVETPRIALGRVPLTLHLLSPASRPVQITTDLASFWRDTYFDVRKDLRGRYPRHAWPDDPLEARALRGVPRRGRP